MTTPMIKIKYRGQETWRFHPRSVDRATAEIHTTRHLGHPPAPKGAEIWRGDEFIGHVRCIHREPFNRFTIVYDPPQEENEEQPDKEAKEDSLLADSLDARIVDLLADHASTTQEVNAMSDEELLAIAGIGPATLDGIRTALRGSD